MAAFLANVGVNAGHAAHSPLFDDGTFALLPIPEKHEWRPPMLRLGDLGALRGHGPRTWQHRAVHLDPDLDSAQKTYGDNCRNAGRAFSLRRAKPKDLVAFIARLHPRNGEPGFHFVACLEIEDAIEDVTSDPGPGWWDANAHVRRARAIDAWDSFWVFKGNAASRRFDHSVRFDRQAAARVFGDTWRWLDHRSELQTIGSYTRAVRRIDGPGEEWLRTICQS